MIDVAMPAQAALVGPTSRCSSSHQRIRRSSYASLLLVTALLACGTPPGAERADVLAYLAHTRTWAPIEAETARLLDRISATQFVDEPEITRQIAEHRPRLLAHLEQVRTYVPRTPDVLRLHKQYTDAWERLLAGLDAIDKGFATGDYTKLAEGREAMDAWRALIVHVADELGNLTRRLGIDPTRAVESLNTAHPVSPIC
jgi:hypothetical protein